MNITDLLLLSLIGCAAGFAAGMLGIGGAIIMIPGMVFLLGMSQQDAQGTSLAVLLLPIGIFATIQYYQKGFVNLKFALILIVAFVIGSYFGSILAVRIDNKILQKVFAVLLLLVGIKMFFNK
jgi:uncharacterized protein